MALLLRLNDFQPGTLILSGQVDAEFNQLVNILSGVSTDKDVLIKYNHALDPALRVDQIGGGFIQRWLASGVEKASINSAGNMGLSGSLTLTAVAPTINFTDSTGGEEAGFISLDANAMRISVNGADYIRFRGGANDDVQVDKPIIHNELSTFIKDVKIDATGSSTGTPRIIGVDPLPANTAARILFGDAFNCIQTSNAGKTTIQSFHTLRIFGHTHGQTEGAETPVGFTAGVTTDPHLEIIGSNGGFGNNTADNVHVQVRGAGNMVAATTPFFRCVTSGGTVRFDILEDGFVKIQGNQVLSTRKTGWGAPTGTATRSTFATGTVTLPQLAERVKALIDDLTSHGMIGA